MQLIKRVDNILDEGIGYIEQWDNSESNKSFENRIETITKIASVCYGKDEAKNPKKLFNRLSKESKGLPSSSFEFVVIDITDFIIDNKKITKFDEKDIENFYQQIIKFGYWDKEKDMILTNYRVVKSYFDKYNVDYLNTNKKEIQNIKDNYFLFKIEMDIVTARQWLRSRIGNYQEKSRRFTKDEPQFYFPENFNKVIVEDMFKNFYDIENYVDLCLKMYDKALKVMPAQEARYILPLGLTTTIWVGGFKDYWRNWLELRLDSHSQNEIRKYAIEIENLIGDKL